MRAIDANLPVPIVRQSAPRIIRLVLWSTVKLLVIVIQDTKEIGAMNALPTPFVKTEADASSTDMAFIDANACRDFWVPGANLVNVILTDPV